MLRDSLLDAWSILSPITCAGCGADDRALCADCRNDLRHDIERLPMTDGTPVFAALDYSGSVRRTILALKESGRTDVARPLAAPLAAAIVTASDLAPTSSVELATIPPSRASFAARGFDPVELMMRKAGFVPARRLLIHTRQPEHQKMLDRRLRTLNLIGSLQSRRSLQGRTFVVVDDVMTTGATLTEAIRAIRAGGGVVVSGATLAYTAKLF